RSFEVSVPVVNTVRLQPLQRSLESLLRSLSNDSWRLTFRQELAIPEDGVEVAQSAGRTLLFSGGLASLAAAIDFGLDGTLFQLVSHTTHNTRTSSAQTELASMLQSLKIKPLHRSFYVSSLSRSPGAHLSYDAESSQRTRSFLFLTLAVLSAR